MTEHPSSEWLSSAAYDLELARAIPADSREARRRILGFCQQAAEKAVKSVLLEHHGEFAYVHNIAELLASVRAIDVPPDVAGASQLTDYYIEGRYPSGLDPSSSEVDDAIELAATVVDWARSVVPHAR